MSAPYAEQIVVHGAVWFRKIECAGGLRPRKAVAEEEDGEQADFEGDDQAQRPRKRPAEIAEQESPDDKSEKYNRAVQHGEPEYKVNEEIDPPDV